MADANLKISTDTSALQTLGVMGEIAAERLRQVEAEGWTLDRDDVVNARGELSEAAACYAIARPNMAEFVSGIISELWPWSAAWWKPRDRRRNLIKAGALIVAEIERLDRAAGR